MQKTVSAGWQREWKWKGPMGCLVVSLLGMILAGLVTFLVFQVMKSSGAYTGALALAQESPALADELGTPLEDGWFVTGSVNINGPTGNAELSIPLAGPEGSGTMYVIAHKRAGEWEFEVLEVEVEGRGERLDLLAER